MLPASATKQFIVEFLAESGSEVNGFADLDAATQAEIEGYIAEGNAVKAGKGKAPKASSGTKRKAKRDEDEDDEEEDDDEEEEQQPPQSKKQRTAEPAAPRAAGANEKSGASTSTASSSWSGAGKVVLFTGFRDAVLESGAKASGASVAGSFTKAVNLLIVADAGVDNAKTKEAASKGVPVMTADEFAMALGVERAGKGKAAPAKAKAGAGTTKAAPRPSDDDDEDDGEDEEEEEERKPAKKAASKPAAAATKTTASVAAPTGSGGWSPAGQVVVFSGFRDKAFEEAVISGGGSVATSFTKAVTLVVSNDPSGSTGNVKEARAKGVRVVSGEEFGAMVHAAPVKEIKKPAPPIPGAVGSLPAGWSAAGQVVLFTGFRDDGLEKSIRSAGGDIAKSFTKAVTLVVAKDASVNTGKVAEALAKGIPVADAVSLAGALGAPVPAKVSAGTATTASAAPQSGSTSANGNTWSHAKLGAFTRAGKYGGNDWEGTVTLTGVGECDIRFSQADGSTSTPTSAALASMLDVVKEAKKFIQLSAAYLWDDFNGKVPGHMWWSNSLEEVRENCDGQTIGKPADVSKQMQLSSIIARDNGDIVLSFEAEFEQEHGVDVLVVNGKVTDVGYQCDL